MVRADSETELMFLPPQWLVLVGLSSCPDKDSLQLSLVCNLREGAAIYNCMWIKHYQFISWELLCYYTTQLPLVILINVCLHTLQKLLS